jgi:hypothetical protein
VSPVAVGNYTWTAWNIFLPAVPWGTKFDWNYSKTTNGTTDVGFNISSQASWLGYMYYQNLGLKGYYSPSGVFQPNYGVFGNGVSGAGLQAKVGLVNNLDSLAYWTGTPYYSPNPSVYNYELNFNTDDGGQYINLQTSAMAVWAVRAGTAADIAATVPEPESYAMLLAGLGLLGVAARSRKTA